MRMILTVCVLAFLIGCNPNMWKGNTGAKGEVGATGPQGPRGESGESCDVVKLGSVTNITCEGTTVQVVDGEDSQPVLTISLCPGLGGGTFKEYLLKIAGEFYGVYASGQKIGLTKLSPGNWLTTDGRNCSFTINIDNTLNM